MLAVDRHLGGQLPAPAMKLSSTAVPSRFASPIERALWLAQ